jgi:hypothetical protein
LKCPHRALATWSQPDREFGFSHWDQVFKTRKVARGAHVHPLPVGTPLPTFANGGAGAAELDRYASEYKLAGLVVLVNGTIRLERYGLGHSAGGRRHCEAAPQQSGFTSKTSARKLQQCLE